MTTQPTPETAEFAPDWASAATVDAQLVNQLLVQVGLPDGAGLPEGVYCTFGVATPPIVIGPPDMVAEQLAAHNGRLPVQSHAKIFLTRDRLEEFVTVLQTALENLNTIEESVRASHHV